MNNRVLIVDDHPAICMVVRTLLVSEGFEVVAETGNGAEALAGLKTFRPALMILDLGILGIEGLTVISKTVAKHPSVKIIVLTGQSPSHLSERCMRMGAHGFVSKENELSELLYAARVVLGGERYFPGVPCVACNQDSGTKDHELLKSLSAREFSVMQQLVKGMSNKEIAGSLLLNHKTVSTYKSRLFNKLNVGSVLGLYALARHNGLA
ncbi:response regulator transcription factor [Pseudomonas kielensis]|uniref:response regulator transcription factor n=1 Tax=Pseudomonas kielensis TaxID=2762577 RepID=UPI00223F7A0F|nr:response regulator transcription factor [Pseudomonas kielensis]UZM16326.1 response regulator transcription factor [Pseudomonas kielensis]